MKRKLKLTITKIRRETSAFTLRAFCPVCRYEVDMISEDESAVFLAVENYALEAMIARGQIHAVRTASGAIRICKNSLLR